MKEFSTESAHFGRVGMINIQEMRHTSFEEGIIKYEPRSEKEMRNSETEENRIFKKYR